jgi:hypothetical protein
MIRLIFILSLLWLHPLKITDPERGYANDCFEN